MKRETRNSKLETSPPAARRRDPRTLLLIAAGTLIGLAWAWFNLRQAGDARGPGVVRLLVWAICATPLATWLGWTLARPRELGQAALTCLAIYFFSIFVAARLERLALGREEAERTLHVFYFNAVLASQCLAGLASAIQRAASPPQAEAARKLEDVVK